MNPCLSLDIQHKISEMMRERYSARYKKMGYDVKTLGWGTIEQQRYRFSQTLAMGISFSEKRIVDFGCGFGDFVDFLIEMKIPFGSYIGVDINPDLIQEALKRHSCNTNIEFQVIDLLAPSSDCYPLGDIGIMLGLLNLNLGQDVNNYDYSKEMIGNAFKLVQDDLIVDFISTYRTEEYPEEDFIFYHDPSIVLKYLLAISQHILLKHNYSPLPQKEFMVALSKGE